MDTQIEKALSALQARHINGIFAEDASEANRYILVLDPIGCHRWNRRLHFHAATGDSKRSERKGSKNSKSLRPQKGRYGHTGIQAGKGKAQERNHPE